MIWLPLHDLVPTVSLYLFGGRRIILVFINTHPDEYPTISSYVTLFVHSPMSTSTPSLSPTCGIGSYGDDSGCERCPPGTYGSSIGLDSCTKCSMNYYTSLVEVSVHILQHRK
jgi:hypothetical protein